MDTWVSPVIIAQALGVVSAIDAIMTARTSQGAVAWGISLITFPYVAVPAYWVLGRSGFKGFAEARRENEAAIDALIERVTPQIEASYLQPEEPMPNYDALVRLSQSGVSGANRTELLIDGEATYNSILEGIATAQKYVLVEFYIVRDDQTGRRLKNALIERAQHDVRVYFVFDEIGSTNLPKAYMGY